MRLSTRGHTGAVNALEIPVPELKKSAPPSKKQWPQTVLVQTPGEKERNSFSLRVVQIQSSHKCLAGAAGSGVSEHRAHSRPWDSWKMKKEKKSLEFNMTGPPGGGGNACRASHV